MSYAFSIGYGKKAVSEGAWAFSPGPVSEMATELRRHVVRDDPRAGRHPRRDGARARDLRHDRPRLLRPRPRRPAAVVLREDVASRHAVGREPDGRRRRDRPDAARRSRRTTRTQFGFVDPDGKFVPFFPNDQFATFILSATIGSFAIELVYLVLAIVAFRLVCSSGNKWWQYLIVAVAVATPILGFYGALNPEPHDSVELQLGRRRTGRSGCSSSPRSGS